MLVARMEHSDIRGTFDQFAGVFPDFAPLNPGYGATGSARQDDEIGADAGLRTQALIGNDQRCAGRE